MEYGIRNTEYGIRCVCVNKPRYLNICIKLMGNYISYILIYVDKNSIENDHKLKLLQY